MNRRKFVKSGAALGALLTFSNDLFGNNTSRRMVKPKNQFQLNYAPHEGMFKEHAGEAIVDQIKYMNSLGFKAFEDNEMRNRSVSEQEYIAKTMAKLGMNMGVFVAHKIYWKEPNLASGDKTYREEFLNDIKKSIEVAKRVNAKWMTVVPGHVDLRKNMSFQMANVIETLKQASEILEPHGLIMVLEPLNFRDHPGMFLSESPQAYEICKSVNSSSCKILFDIYHQQIQEGNLLPNIEACWDEIAYFQIGDNPGRNEPTTGEINYKNVFKYIHGKGYKGILGMEHSNSVSGKKGEQLLIEAYKSVDDF
ncbi:hydroxypyruvate isomerase [Tenacibaculum sp. MAR_2009_124]|uniref:hydroxypyruvate isomerase family protein n=1 Tax=Tenacibaculum sp. MAR_2009_124 TaxID=1250059 RepID=UPI00089CB118|nr:TIM barrel protein [Tenacibaculum sp. MAR_2009_124]SED20938.1 hydroxypyruvate isomerase [Tenacibaculum sp. MAR_2009_124]